MGDPAVGGRILEKYIVKVWTELYWLMIESNGKLFMFHKNRDFFLAKWQFANYYLVSEYLHQSCFSGYLQDNNTHMAEYLHMVQLTLRTPAQQPSLHIAPALKDGMDLHTSCSFTLQIFY